MKTTRQATVLVRLCISPHLPLTREVYFIVNLALLVKGVREWLTWCVVVERDSDRNSRVSQGLTCVWWWRGTVTGAAGLVRGVRAWPMAAWRHTRPLTHTDTLITPFFFALDSRGPFSAASSCGEVKQYNEEAVHRQTKAQTGGKLTIHKLFSRMHHSLHRDDVATWTGGWIMFYEQVSATLTTESVCWPHDLYTCWGYLQFKSYYEGGSMPKFYPKPRWCP